MHNSCAVVLYKNKKSVFNIQNDGICGFFCWHFIKLMELIKADLHNDPNHEFQPQSTYYCCRISC